MKQKLFSSFQAYLPNKKELPRIATSLLSTAAQEMPCIKPVVTVLSECGLFSSSAQFALPVAFTALGTQALSGASPYVAPTAGYTNPASTTVGTAFAWAFKTNGDSAASYSVTGLPAGIVYTYAGNTSTLSGTATTPGTYNVGITGYRYAGMAGNATATYYLTLNVIASGPYVNISSSTSAVSDAAGSVTLGITANTSWTVSSDASWLTASASSGSNNATLTINYSANPDYAPRVGHITVKDKTFTVTQNSNSTYTSLNASSATILSYAGSFPLGILSNTSWTASSSASWLHVSASSGSNSTLLILSYEVNPDIAPRTATVTVNGNVFTLTQNPFSARVSVPGDQLSATSGNNAVFDPNYTGLYSSVLTNRNSGNVEGAISPLLLTKTGAFTAKINFAGRVINAKGSFDANGHFNGALALGTLDLQLTNLNGELKVEGTYSANDSTYNVQAFKAAPCAAGQGISSFVIPADDTSSSTPHGDGSFILNAPPTNKLGVVNLLGTLGDGTKVTSKVNMSANGYLPVYTPLYKKTGNIGGLLQFRDKQPNSDIDGNLSWSKPGMQTTIRSVGSKNDKSISLNATTGLNPNATLVFLDPVSNQVVTRPIRWNGGNITIITNGTGILKLKSTPKGNVTGSFKGDDKILRNFTGVVLQDQNRVCGTTMVKGRAAGFFFILPL